MGPHLEGRTLVMMSLAVLPRRDIAFAPANAPPQMSPQSAAVPLLPRCPHHRQHASAHGIWKRFPSGRHFGQIRRHTIAEFGMKRTRHQYGHLVWFVVPQLFTLLFVMRIGFRIQKPVLTRCRALVVLRPGPKIMSHSPPADFFAF